MKSLFLRHQKIFTALLAGVGYGGWAVFANFEHGLESALMAGAVQAIYAFLATLIVTKVAQFVFLKYACGVRGIIAGFIASFVVMLAIPSAVHGAARTPDIVQTILPGVILGSLYLISYLFILDQRLRVAPPTKKT